MSGRENTKLKMVKVNVHLIDVVILEVCVCVCARAFVSLHQLATETTLMMDTVVRAQCAISSQN